MTCTKYSFYILINFGRPKRQSLIVALVATVLIFHLVRSDAQIAAGTPNSQAVDVSMPKMSVDLAQIKAETKAQLAQIRKLKSALDSSSNSLVYNENLERIATLYFNIGHYPEAREYYQKELESSEARKDLVHKVSALNGIGFCYLELRPYFKAEEIFQQSLEISEFSSNTHGHAVAMTGIAIVTSTNGDSVKAKELFATALQLSIQLKDEVLQALILQHAGFDLYIENNAKGVEALRRSLFLYEKHDNSSGQARTMSDMCWVYMQRNEIKEAQNCYSSVLNIYEVSNNKDGKGDIYNELADVANSLGDWDKSISFYKQAANSFGQVPDLAGKAMAFINIAQEDANYAIDPFIHDPKEKEETRYHSKALRIYQQLNDLIAECPLISQGPTSQHLGTKYVCEQALALEKKSKDRRDEASTLYILAGLTSVRESALDLYRQALLVYRQLNDTDGEIKALISIGESYPGFITDSGFASDKESQDAFILAFLLARKSNSTEIFFIGTVLMSSYSAIDSNMAIYYGKAAVNSCQSIRIRLKSHKVQQTSFVKETGRIYQDLADLLIDQGRLPEAQQVIDLMKEQEYSDFVRGAAKDSLHPLSYTPAEEKADAEYMEFTKTHQTVAESERLEQLKALTTRTPEQDAEMAKLKEDVKEANLGFEEYRKHLFDIFGDKTVAEKKDSNANLSKMQDHSSDLQQTIADLPHTVALYTFLASDHYHVILITGSTQIAREYPIAETDLNKKVMAFKEILKDPTQDPRPLAQELYKILFAPVKADLDQIHADTLVWELDGTLRYIPMAALYDGKQFLVENYNNVTFAPEGRNYLSAKPNMQNMNAVAMGISRKYEDNLDDLASVVGELDDIVKDPNVKDAHGVLPGTILLNNQFTEKAMQDQLGSKHSVVHIASHFVLNPGDEDKSFLLLAGKDKDATGYHLTMADFRTDPDFKFHGTDLLTLSACETGVVSNASNGREVDGLNITAMLNGAKSVLSTLWPVNDSSTGELMADFYQRWASGGGKVEKVEALRQAQLDLLQGKVKPKQDLADANAPTSFAHPYYWAPFVLMGNWQ